MREEYLTDSGYSRKNEGLTPAAEDYLEMIYRMSHEGGEREPVRICALAERLHVSPSSASRMAQSMTVWGYLDFKRYGYITLTERGIEMGKYLVDRHETVLSFLGWLTGEESLIETERIEHYLSRGTVEAMTRILEKEKERSESGGQK
ncbi:MAG: metal-dependent transcriptional regulator [Ruminococcaceae bacterium]|nr:metal-dependent transcriptional regulator [Oscillospiraceae bacterium]